MYKELIKKHTKLFKGISDFYEIVNEYGKSIRGKKLKDIKDEIKILRSHSYKLKIVIFDEYGNSDYDSLMDYIRNYPDAVVVDLFVQNSGNLVYESSLNCIYIDLEVRIGKQNE